MCVVFPCICAYRSVCTCVDGVCLWIYVYMCAWYLCLDVCYVWLGMCKSVDGCVYLHLSVYAVCVCTVLRGLICVPSPLSVACPVSVGISGALILVGSLLLAAEGTSFYSLHQPSDLWSWCPSSKHSLLVMLRTCSASTSQRGLWLAESKLVAFPSAVSCEGCESSP